MHTVHSSVGSFCPIMRNVHMIVSMCSKMIHRILQFSVQVPAMLGFSRPSFNLTFKHDDHYEWHAHFQHVPLCDKTIPKGRFCKLNSTKCRPGSRYTNSNLTNCQVCLSCHQSFLPCQVLRMSKCALIDPAL